MLIQEGMKNIKFHKRKSIVFNLTYGVYAVQVSSSLLRRFGWGRVSYQRGRCSRALRDCNHQARLKIS